MQNHSGMIQEHVVHSDRRKSDLNTGVTVTGALKYLLPYAKLAKKKIYLRPYGNILCLNDLTIFDWLHLIT